MKSVYAKTRILLVPSVWQEGWGRVVTEAQLNGIPVIASNLGGLPESVGPGGIIVNPGADLGEWQTALSRLWDDVTQYEMFSKAALEHSQREEIRPERLLKELLEVISALVKRPRQ